MFDLEAFFAEHEDEFLKFDRVTSPRHSRPDLCAFLILDDLDPKPRDMVCAAEHDEIWLDADVEKVAQMATKEDLLTLIRCGVMYDAANESFHMFA